MADAADDVTVTRFSKCQEEYSIEDVDRLAFLRIMTSSRSLGCCKTWRITSRIGACQACLHLTCMFTDVCACEIRRREDNEASRCACPDGIFPSQGPSFVVVCPLMTPWTANLTTVDRMKRLAEPERYPIRLKSSSLGRLHSRQLKLQALVCDILLSCRKVPESDARSVQTTHTSQSHQRLCL